MEHHHFSWVNQRTFDWAIFQFAFCMFTRPGIQFLSHWLSLLNLRSPISRGRRIDHHTIIQGIFTYSPRNPHIFQGFLEDKENHGPGWFTKISHLGELFEGKFPEFFRRYLDLLIQSWWISSWENKQCEQNNLVGGIPTYPSENDGQLKSVGMDGNSQDDGKVIQNSMVPNHQPEDIWS